jgi:hypothetical protein
MELVHSRFSAVSVFSFMGFAMPAFGRHTQAGRLMASPYSRPFFCSTEWRAFFVSPGGVWGSAPKEFSAHLGVCGNAPQNLHYPNKSD